MRKGFFITGTDTDVGKTVTSFLLCKKLGFSYYKPIQTGIDTDQDYVIKLSDGKIKTYDSAYHFIIPSSPHYAAKVEKKVINLDSVRTEFNEGVIVEGAGGVMVPINDDNLMVDLIKKMSLPTIIVARGRLGTINHTLLTIEALRSRSIDIHGVILNGDVVFDNIEVIERYGKTKVLCAVPTLDSIEDISNFNINLNV